MHRLEVRDQAGAVEDAAAEVAGERGQPGAAEQAAEVAHRALAADARPVGQRRPRQQDRARQIGPDRAHHHDLPARLAIADQDRLALGARMPRRHGLDEARLGAADILDGLPGYRLGQEADEVAGMAGGQSLADLAVVLHPADARAVPRPRVEDHERALGVVDGGSRRRDDAHQAVVHRPFELVAAEDQLVLEGEDVRGGAGAVLQGVVAALAQHVQQQDPALPRVEPVGRDRVDGPCGLAGTGQEPGRVLRRRSRGSSRARRRSGRMGICVMVHLSSGRIPSQEEADVARHAAGPVEDLGAQLEAPRLQLALVVGVGPPGFALEVLGPVRGVVRDRAPLVRQPVGRAPEHQRLLLPRLDGPAHHEGHPGHRVPGHVLLQEGLVQLLPFGLRRLLVLALLRLLLLLLLLDEGVDGVRAQVAGGDVHGVGSSGAAPCSRYARMW